MRSNGAPSVNLITQEMLIGTEDDGTLIYIAREAAMDWGGFHARRIRDIVAPSIDIYYQDA